MENKIILPIELVNKILIMRPTHPIAKLIIKPIIKEYRLHINNSMWSGTFDEYLFNWYNEYGYKYEDDNWKESDDFEDENYEDFSSGIDYGTRYREEDYIESDSDSDSEGEVEVVIKYIKEDSDSDSDSDSEEI